MNNPLRRNKSGEKDKKEHPYSSVQSAMKEHPYTVYKNAINEEAKRVKCEKQRQLRLERRHRRNPKSKVLLMNNNNGSTTGDDSSDDDSHGPAYEIIVMPQKPRSALEIYLMDHDAKGTTNTMSQFQLKQQWRKLSVEEKVMYENLALDDRLRFDHEKKMYKQGQNEGEDVSDLNTNRMGQMRKRFSGNKKKGNV